MSGPLCLCQVATETQSPWSHIEDTCGHMETVYVSRRRAGACFLGGEPLRRKVWSSLQHGGFVWLGLQLLTWAGEVGCTCIETPVGSAGSPHSAQSNSLHREYRLTIHSGCLGVLQACIVQYLEKSHSGQSLQREEGLDIFLPYPQHATECCMCMWEAHGSLCRDPALSSSRREYSGWVCVQLTVSASTSLIKRGPTQMCCWCGTDPLHMRAGQRESTLGTCQQVWLKLWLQKEHTH